MIYKSQEIAEFFKGKIIEEPKDLKEAKLTTKSIEQQQKIVLEGLKTLDKESLFTRRTGVRLNIKMIFFS